MPYYISDDCIGCGACSKKCPENAISGEIKVRFEIDPSLCQECGVCFQTCRQGVVEDPFGRRSPVKREKKALKACIDPGICAGCKTCFLNCPQEAVYVIKKGIFSSVYCQVDTELCVGCGTCVSHCITNAVSLE